MDEKLAFIQNKLIFLFEDMLDKLPNFKKAKFEAQFQESYHKHKSICEVMTEYIDENQESVSVIADFLPAHVQSLMSESKKKNRHEMSMKYNMNMAVYVIPILTYNKDDNCRKVAEKTVNLWNEKRVTDLTLGLSSYEIIASGFRKKMCYITTAVCQALDKDDHCEELTCLRRYRDDYLMNIRGGSDLIEEYYEIAPALVLMINMHPDREIIYEGIYSRYITPCLMSIKENDMEGCRSLYESMVNQLKNTYYIV